MDRKIITTPVNGANFKGLVGRISPLSPNYEHLNASIQELNAALGLAKLFALTPEAKNLLEKVELKLLHLHISSTPEPSSSLTEADLSGLVNSLNYLKSQIEELHLPPTLQSKAAGHLNLAKRICDRVIIETKDFRDLNFINPTLFPFLEHLSQLLALIEKLEYQKDTTY